MEKNEFYDKEKDYFMKMKNEKKKKKKKKKINKQKNKETPFFIIIFKILITLIFVCFYFIKENFLQRFKKENDKLGKISLSNTNNTTAINYKYENISDLKKEFTEEEYLKEMQEFIHIIANEKLIDPNEKIQKVENPKISIVISVYNGEGLLKPGLRSVQNQDFKDIEIIIVDDYSKDNSVNLIENLIKEDPRIILLKNKENKGILYTKAIGVLNSKGKYVMTLDVDDVYSSRYAFSTLFFEAEKNDLDILGFASMGGPENIYEQERFKYHYYETPVLFQPQVFEKIYVHQKNGGIIRTGLVIWNYFFRTDLFIKSINQIDNNYMDLKLLFNDDLMFFFLLTKNARNLKQIKRVFYYHLGRNKTEPLIAFRYKIKDNDRINKLCYGNIIYADFLLNKTNETFYEKKIASFELKNLYLNNKECRANNNTKELSIQVCKKFLENKYIEENVKTEIISYINETKNILH